MKYIANPVEVDAYVIKQVDDAQLAGGVRGIQTWEGRNFLATPEMLSRMTPKPGDYVVVQSDGYIYLNPKEVFERKYAPVSGSQAQSAGH